MWQTLVHNRYHLGQVVALRQALGAWPPPTGRDTWQGNGQSGFGGHLPDGVGDAKLHPMKAPEADEIPMPREPDIDESGVDLAQVRQMLDLTPAERLTAATNFMNSLLEIRARNDNRGAG